MKKIKNFKPEDWVEHWANGPFYMHKTTGEKIPCDDYWDNCDIYNARPENHVFESTVTKTGKKVWQYHYADENGNNQHSGYYDTKEQAIEAYRKNHPRMVLVPETLIEEIIEWKNRCWKNNPIHSSPSWSMKLEEMINELNQ